MGLFLLAFVTAGMLFVFPRAIQAKEPCPHDINPDDSAWVLREVTEKSAMKNGLDDSYTRWIRVFAYQPDPVKRFRKEFHPTCFAEVHSFVVGDMRSGWQSVFAGMAVYESSSSRFPRISGLKDHS